MSDLLRCIESIQLPNSFEGIWGLVKLKIKSMKGVFYDKISAILDEFTYLHRYGLSDGDVYYKLLSDKANHKRSGEL